MSDKIKKCKTWNVPCSVMAENSVNPIRNLVDSMTITPNPEKDMIALSIGDPTIFGNLPYCEVAENAVIEAIKGRKSNGYTASVGYESARLAVADYTSTPTSVVTAKDVILTSGCSSALDLCISCLANPGQNMLMPLPGFSIYKTLAESLGIEVRNYKLLPEKSWEADLNHIEELIDENTAGIIVNNPSNPCGSVYSKEHLEAILEICEKNKLPVIADEIYEHFVFCGSKYYSLASLTTTVPILSCSGLTKRFLVPGWRMGWIVIHDLNDIFVNVRRGLVKLSQRILGPNTLVQQAIPDILKNTSSEFFEDTLVHMKNNAEIFYSRFREIIGLTPIMPQGAMYMMVGIDIETFPVFKCDIQFVEALVKEQSVFCLPASCFQYPNYFRVVLTIPETKVAEACDRIEEFCKKYYVARNGMNNGNNGVNGHH
ncbi:hypothetical protein LOTGIDRAFT_227234 [Lottia gigantea]|uniref:Tyrosine aminotransferase n=1 Tax=Lottia gigantea TaxID=225164 RepID=V3ZVR7_LOTGI|nr:hypothetical protein LOTGIDRAFT_227234 [Lottia gigantea]ESO95613.1 hypothetical protein LOTGIDRAFT_227234 [Lottia gigantea]